MGLDAGLLGSLDDSESITISSTTVSDALGLEPTTQPSQPQSGVKLYIDSSDGNKLKAIDSAGNITTIVQ
jgi:hypothetical protein